MALSRDVVIRLVGDAESAVKAQREAAKAAEVTVAQYRKAERDHARMAQASATAARQQQEAMASVGKGAMVMGAVVTAGLGLSVKAAIGWESAWAGVRKTVNGSPAEMAALEKELRNLATTLPATHEEIAGVAEAAGQLGIARGDIAEFTKVAVAMGVSTNLSAEEAATGLAQMMNVMGTASSDIDRMGSTLVALGNAGASTEADILAMSQRLAGAGKLIGASESDVMALASAMADMGIQSELGGGAMSRVLLKIYSAMQDGGAEAEKFAEVAGTSAEVFAAKWRADPVAAADLLVQGLGRVKDEGGNVVQTLGDLGIEGTQNLQVMLSLAGAGDQLTDALATSNKAWADNDALMNEANQRYDTAASKIQIARNQINDAAIDIGGTFMPIAAGAAEVVADLARGFEMLPDGLKTTVGIIGGLAGVIGVAGGAAVVAAPKILAFRTAMATMEASSSAAARGVGRFGMVMSGPWGLAITAGITLLGGLVGALGASSRASESAASYQKDLASALRDSNGAIDDNIRGLAAHKAADEAIGDSNLLAVVEAAGGSLPKLTDALLGVKGGYDDTRASLEAFIADQTRVNEMSGDVFLTEQGEAAKEAMSRLDELALSMGGAVAENERLATASKNSTEATDGQKAATQGLLSGLNGVDDAAATAAGGIAGVGGAADATTEQMSEAEQAIADWRKELVGINDSFVEVLPTYKALLDEKTQAEREAAEKTAANTKDASDSWQDHVDLVEVSLGELADALQKQLENQNSWRTNLGKITLWAGQDVAQYLAAMGEDGVDLVAKMADGTDKEAQRMARLILKDIQRGGDGWTDSMDTDMRILERIGRRGANDTADQIAHELGVGVDEVAAIAEQYGIELARGVNPLLRGLGKPGINISDYGYNSGGGRAEGGYITGPGGPTDDKAGLFALSDGEYVVRSAAVKKYGRSFMEDLNIGRLATGGYVSADDVPRPPSTNPYRAPISTAGDATMKRGYDDTRKWVSENAQLYGGNFGASNPSPNGVGGLGPAAAAAREFVMRTFGLFNIGGYSYRNIAGTNTLSDHATGHAIDAMLTPDYNSAAKRALGNRVASWFVGNPKAFGTKYVIYYDQINSGSGWQPYGHPGGFGDDTSQHRDHVHVSFYKNGTPYVPSDRLAYLHQGERVIPAEQNRQYAMPVTGAAAMRALAVQVNIEGARLMGTLDMGDGIFGQLEGIVVDAITTVTNRAQY